MHCCPPLPASRPPHHHAQHQQLQHGQHGGAVDVAELRGAAGDLHLQRRVRRPAQQAHGAERCEREQEDDGGGRPQRGPQQGQHHEPQHLLRRSAKCACSGGEVGGHHRPHRAHQPHHDGDVEEHMGDDHSPCRAMPRRREEREKGRADHDGGQHERHGDRRQQSAAAGKPIAGKQVRRREPDEHGQQRARHRLPQGEPQHAPEAGSAQRIADRTRSHHARQQRAQRPEVEHRQPHHRQRGQRGHQPARQTVQRNTISVHWSCHFWRLAAMVAGSIVNGSVGTTANLVNTSGSTACGLAG